MPDMLMNSVTSGLPAFFSGYTLGFQVMFLTAGLQQILLLGSSQG
jgi:hypothetical protein